MLHKATQNLIIASVDTLVNLASEDNKRAAQAVRETLMSALSTPASASTSPDGRTGRASLGVTITVGPYGYVVCATRPEAAALLGISANTLGVRLSQTRGKYILRRQDPETHNPMAVTVEVGKLAEETPLAREILDATPSRNKAARPRKVAPVEKDERGFITTNRLRRDGPRVINS